MSIHINIEMRKTYEFEQSDYEAREFYSLRASLDV